MTFFYDLNKRLAALADKQDLHESKVAESEKWIQKAVNPAHKGNLHKALHVAQDKTIPKAKIEKATHSKNPKLRHMAQFAKNVANEDQVNELSVNKLNDIKGSANRIARDERMSGGDETRANKAERVAGKASVRANDKVQAGMKANGMIDELSTAALKSYDQKSTQDVANRIGGMTQGNEKDFKKIADRQRGAERLKTRAVADEGNAFSGAVAKAKANGIQPGEKITVGGNQYPVKEAGKPMTPKQKSFAKLAPPTDKITFADRIAGAKKEVDEMLGDVAAEAIKGAVAKKKEPRSAGTAFDRNFVAAQHKKEQGTGKFDSRKVSTGTVYTRKPETFAGDDSEETTSNEPKRRGRPMGKPKGPERVTKGAWKHKGARKEKADEDLDSDSVMMTRPTNCSSESAADKSALKSAIALLKKNGYNVSKKETMDEESTDKEDQRAERAGKRVAKDIEYDKGHKGKDDNRAEKDGKRVTKDIEYDDKKNKTKKVDEFFDNQVTVKGGDARTAGGNAGVSGVSSTGGSSGASNLNKNSATGGSANSNSSSKANANANANADSTNEEKVDETAAAPKASKGMQFGKGVYENLDNKFKKALTESIAIESKMEESDMGGGQSITIQASGAEADMLMQLLKAAGLSGQSQACGTCGATPCGCDQQVDENSPDWPTNTEKIDAEPNLRTYSGGLNGPKSTGQTTVPVVASQLRRQVSMEENVELERSLFKTWKNYKG